MRLITSTSGYLNLKVIENEHKIYINYELLELTSNRYISIDRGFLTDRYSTIFTFTGKKDYIDGILQELNTLRTLQLPIKFDQVDEPFFGDNINHSGVLNCTLFDVDKQEFSNFNVNTVKLEFILNDPIYLSDIGLPDSLHCLKTKWQGFSKWHFTVNETYNRKNYFVDNVKDRYEFTGKYTLTLEDNIKLLNFWRFQRGNVFTINEEQFGGTELFGSNAGTGPHDVIIKEIKYTRVSSIYRDVEITLMKVG